MSHARVNLAAEVDPDLLLAVRELADREGRPLHELVDEALADLIQKHRSSGVRPHVMKAYLESHEKYASLYAKLAG